MKPNNLLLFVTCFLLIQCITSFERNACIDAVAKCIMSEASTGSQQEKIVIGYACQRNRRHATGQRPTKSIRALAQKIVDKSIDDISGGADHWYSPRSMPMENQKSRCSRSDCKGGLEKVPGLKSRNYKPSWSNETRRIRISGVRDSYFKFYRLGDAPPLSVCH